MERKRRLGIIWIPILMTITLLMYSSDAKAQAVTKLHDKSKLYQLRSMEDGKWEFHPGLYYLLVHKNYSGGYWKGLNIKWDVKKSNVGQIAEVRASEVGLEALSAKSVQAQIDSIAPIAKEETIRSGERMVDMMYWQYKDDFEKAFDGIDELTTVINDKSNGELIEDALAILEEKDLLKAEIEYIHETGPTKQMEQAKRQLAYEEVLQKLKKLYDRSYKLAYFAHTLNNLKK